MSTVNANELPENLQRRNSFVFFLITSLYYLVAPMFYVGVLHAAILDSLGVGHTVANLPQTIFLWFTPLPVLITWLWPSPGLLRPMLTASLLVNGTAGLTVAILFVVAPDAWLVPALIAHAGIVGVTNGVRNMCVWELIGRGLSPARRGWTLGWTFGVSPLFAVLGSCASQGVLSGNLLEVVQMRPIPPPWSYVLLFGCTGPVMVVSAALVALAHVPPVTAAGRRLCIQEIRHGLQQYFCNPLILVAAVGFLLTYGGTLIMNNLSLYARDALGAAPESYAGLQLALRFGCKCLCGFAFGLLVSKVHAKASLLATTAAGLAGVLWALIVPGKGYLLSFGLLGAGELFYVYYLNYIVGCSAPERIRENTAYTNLLTATVGVLPVFYGFLSLEYGLRASFVAAIALFMTALAIVGRFLPRQPLPVTHA